MRHRGPLKRAMIKFFVDKEDILENKIYLSSTEDRKHLLKVLRARVGDEVVISDKTRWEYLTVIEDITDTDVVLKITDKKGFKHEPLTRVTLYQGVPKGPKLETVVQKTVELGVGRIVPVFMARTVVQDKGNFGKKVLRLQKIADEAVKQCKRGIIPEVSEAVDFGGMLEDLRAGEYDGIILAYENESGYSMKDAIRDRGGDLDLRKGSKVALIIGPEGGFEQEEVEAVLEEFERKAVSVTLGKTILRTETAGPAALAMIMYEIEL